MLNESLSTAPKLTDSQLAALAVIFLFKYAQSLGIGNHQTLGEFFDNYVAPFALKLVKNMVCYQHLEFSDCGSIGLGEATLEFMLGNNYQGLFLKGFEANEIEKRVSLSVKIRDFSLPALTINLNYRSKLSTKNH